MPPAARLWRWGDPPQRLLDVWRAGGVVVIPTESSYALAADPRNPDAVRDVFTIKRRSADKPLPVVIGDLAHLDRLGVSLPPAGLGGLEAAWPGPLTILLPCAPGLPAAAGSEKLAVRIPGHDRLRRLLCIAGHGVTATSANVSGQKPILEVDEAIALVAGREALVVDDGRLPGGEPSTMVALEARVATVVRRGRLPRERLAELAPQWFSAGSVEIPVEERD